MIPWLAPSPPGKRPMTVRILFVSTGDVCRAPMAVGCLRTLVDRAHLADAFEIDSAGTLETAADQPPSLLAQEAAARRGYPIRDLRARRLEPEDIAHFTYPLALDRTHLAAMRMIAPGHLTERPQLLLRYVPKVGVNDVQDPYGGTTADYEKALDLIECGCAGLLEHVGKVMAGQQSPSLFVRDDAAAARGDVEPARIIDPQNRRLLR